MNVKQCDDYMKDGFCNSKRYYCCDIKSCMVKKLINQIIVLKEAKQCVN